MHVAHNSPISLHFHPRIILSNRPTPQHPFNITLRHGCTEASHNAPPWRCAWDSGLRWRPCCRNPASLNRYTATAFKYPPIHHLWIVSLLFPSASILNSQSVFWFPFLSFLLQLSLFIVRAWCSSVQLPHCICPYFYHYNLNLRLIFTPSHPKQLYNL
ncbi:hypothetical protein P152DRAFT_297906 [Eremomyces bilateralis CBS 781.70]|uniref:Uncharacterized protein n=1 Tax=Eremomyces bilateralis CBS 781.70 TaxID=1392243 RepID=A0A6G1G7U1_9PEZI|nr:uncharacterized protein P152DRAFT_297906 [Eremomyces bilateralis CBS 781.70]KAF1813919.1 hypothetical protein P152DRAFT_297906 [Eremomyces bilateralis CBS 781.70]